MTTAEIMRIQDELNAAIKFIARTPDLIRQLEEQELQNAAAQLADDEDEWCYRGIGWFTQTSHDRA